jgi:uncharacterized protein (DUF2236 family)
MQDAARPVASSASPPAPAGTAKKVMPRVDFQKPSGAPALYSPDSLSWQVFKNPVALFVGGVTAVLLELAEPRVRSGVWGHSIFPVDPLTRMRRTGAVTHATIYAPAETATRIIQMVNRMHDRVAGQTPAGVAYRANDPVLLDWVQATASFGFMEAYSAFVRPFSDEERDRFYAESKPAALLFGATGAPVSLAEQRRQFEAMRPALEDHHIVHEFLGIMKKTPALPIFFRPLQAMMLRAAVSQLPDWVRERLNLGEEWRLKSWERNLLCRLGAFFDRVPVAGTPPVQACQRLGLPGNFLYRRTGTPST